MLSTFHVMQIRPYLISDGGNVELSEIDGPVVYLKLQGACGSCPSSMTTMTMGIRRRLMEKIPVSSQVAVCFYSHNIGQTVLAGTRILSCTDQVSSQIVQKMDLKCSMLSCSTLSCSVLRHAVFLWMAVLVMPILFTLLCWQTVFVHCSLMPNVFQPIVFLLHCTKSTGGCRLLRKSWKLSS